jgi:hypothetical protein
MCGWYCSVVILVGFRVEFGDIRRSWDFKKWRDSHGLSHYGTTPEEVLVGIVGERKSRMEESTVSEDSIVAGLGDGNERIKDTLLPEPANPAPSATPLDLESTPCNETPMDEEDSFDFA